MRLPMQINRPNLQIENLLVQFSFDIIEIEITETEIGKSQ